MFGQYHQNLLNAVYLLRHISKQKMLLAFYQLSELFNTTITFTLFQYLFIVTASYSKNSNVNSKCRKVVSITDNWEKFRVQKMIWILQNWIWTKMRLHDVTFYRRYRHRRLSMTFLAPKKRQILTKRRKSFDNGWTRTAHQKQGKYHILQVQ